MQHYDLDTVLQAFSGADLEPPVGSWFGLSVASLRPQAARGDSGPAFAVSASIADMQPPRDAPGLVWKELVAPHPRRVRVRNLSGAAVIVEPGSVLLGGMSSRAVARTVVVPPRGDVVVGVESVGARWWDEGELRTAGSLTAVAAAVMFQAGFGEGPGASSARTALMSFGRSDVDRTASRAEPGGWVVLDTDRVLAGWLAERPLGEFEWSGAPALMGGLQNVGSTVIASLRRGLRDGALAAHVIDHDVGGRDWIVVPRTFDLVDAVVGAASMSASR